MTQSKWRSGGFGFVTLFLLTGNVDAEILQLQGTGTLDGGAPVGVAGEELTVTVILNSDEFSYVSVPNPSFHYFVPDAPVSVSLVGSITGPFADVSPIDRFLAVEFEEGSDLISLDVSSGTTSTSVFSLFTEVVNGFDGTTTPFEPTELFSLFVEAFENETLWHKPASTALFVGSEGDMLTMTNLEWSLFDLNDSLGDFDSDGDVDGRDFLVWQRGDSPTPLTESDLGDWQENYGAGPLVGSLAVPEPSISAMLFSVVFTVARILRTARF